MARRLLRGGLDEAAMELAVAARTDTAGRHLLVVERDMIVGLSLAVDLLDLGYRVSGPFISLAEVSSLLRDDPPDGAIVDVELRDGTGLGVARALQRLAIPFVMFSAGDSRDLSSGEFFGVPWIEKPATTDCVMRLLDDGHPPAAAA